VDPVTALLVTALLLAGNAFFVATEFALVAARRPRLERAASRGSRPAEAAIAGIDELPLMLAGAQLGITMCSLGLGAVTEPAFEAFLGPPLNAVGAPAAVRHAVAFTVALSAVTFLHMVVGEMAPKSWAITHAERSALLLALPFRGFAWLSRPLLAALNGATNALLRLIRVRPPGTAPAHTDPRRLSHLIGESRRLGLIGHPERQLLDRAIDTHHRTIAPLIVPATRVTTVPAGASADRIRRVSARSGHTRLLVRGDDGAIRGLLHVRDAITGRGLVTYRVPALAPDTSVLRAVTALRRARSQLAVVATPGEPFVGIVSLDDLLGELLSSLR
jgi:CBS domain containing-hemolysin-like protein